MTTAHSPLLAVDEATLTFRVKPTFGPARQVQALRKVSFSLEPGRALAIVGESGSGKSTIGRAIAGLLNLEAGNIRFKGRDIGGKFKRNEWHEYLSAVQMVFQDPFAVLNPVHRIGHHIERPIAIQRRLSGKALRTAAEEVLASVELDPAVTYEKFPHELSGGQRQRVNLARALAMGPELIIADEPTSMLDVSIRRSVLELMRRLKSERKIAFLYITHDIATAHYLAEDTLVMFAGQVVEWGPSERIVANPLHPYTRLLLSAVPNPDVRLSGDDIDGKAFSRQANIVREIAREAGPIEEAEPGHFVRITAPLPGASTASDSKGEHRV